MNKYLFRYSVIMAFSCFYLLCGPAFCDIAISLPSDFSGIQGENGIYYEAIGDTRSSNTLNPGPATVVNLQFDPSGQIEQRPVYGHFPFIALAEEGYITTHPGTGGFNLGTGTSNIGASIRFQAPESGRYRFTGQFAKLSSNGGNGVNALIFTELNVESPLFSQTTTAVGAVDPADPFSNAGAISFDISQELEIGESIRFVVFSDAQGQSGVFDSTPFTLQITNVPDSLLGDCNLDGVVNFLDISTFISILSTGSFFEEADIDLNGEVNFLDISPFIRILSGN